MMTFDQALAEESLWLANVVDQPIPSDDRAGHRVYIGPTAVDLSPVADAEFAAQLAHRKARDEQLFAKRAAGSVRAYWQKPHAKQFY